MANYDSYERAVVNDQGSPGQGSGITSTSASGGAYLPKQVSFYLKQGAGGAAADVTLYNANFPMKAYLLNASFLILNGVSMKTVTLRDATGGGGNALSNALAVDTTGNVVSTTGATQAATALTAGQSIVARLTDSATAGILTLTYIESV